MRVSFLGKGGSGKTTMATSFIKYLESNNEKVLGIDADINVNLAKGLEMLSKPIGDDFDEMSKYFEKQVVETDESLFKKLFNNFKENSINKPIIGTTPPTMQTRFIAPSLDDEFIKKFGTRNKNTAILTVGTYNEEKAGYECYHSKLGSAILIYNRLLDDDSLFVVSDSTAGIDSVGTSMFCVSDINIFLVEPTSKSIGVFKDFQKATSKYTVENYVIANKIRNLEDINYIKSNINENIIIDFVKESEDLRKYEQGDIASLDKFVNQNNDLYKKIYTLLKSNPRDWENYYNNVKSIYTNDVNEWYNKYYSEDLTKYIDPNFSYKKVINKND